MFVSPPAAGRRRAFGDADEGRIIAETARPGAGVSAVACRYGIAARVMFRCSLRQRAGVVATAARDWITVVGTKCALIEPGSPWDRGG